MIGGCARCSFLDACGGLDGAELDFFGCHRAAAETCRKNAWTCPICNLVEYVRRWAEVQVRSANVGPVIPICSELPPYVARIDHAKHWTGILPVDIVAMPTSRIVGGRGRYFGPKYPSRQALLRHFHLQSDTQILLVSVSSDPYLEQYWGWAKHTRTPERLASLGIAGITIPNYSFFSDAHRYHLLYNRARIAACLAELSAAGVPVIPHVHALTSDDRRYWIGWLRANPQVRHVCREFETGNGVAEVEELDAIQQAIGRELHPVIIGGKRFAPRLGELFRRSTIVDATPFIKAQNGQRALVEDGIVRWRSHYTSSKRSRGVLLQHNIHVFEQFLTGKLVPEPQLSMLDTLEQAARAAHTVRMRPAAPQKPDEQQPLLFDARSLSLAPRGVV